MVGVGAVVEVGVIVGISAGWEVLVVIGLILEEQADNNPIRQTTIRNFKCFMIDSLALFDYLVIVHRVLLPMPLFSDFQSAVILNCTGRDA